MTKACSTCIYWHRNTEIAGICRRHAPSRIEKPIPLTVWPGTNEVDWCGDYEMTEIEDGTGNG